MKYLTLEKEYEVLKYLHQNANDLFIGSGSSRAVFRVNQELMEMLALPSVNYVIKMVLGIGGFRQSHLEYKTFMEYATQAPLAEIRAHGNIFTIMEEIKIDRDFMEFYDYYDCDVRELLNDRDTDPDEEYALYELYSEAKEVIERLDELFGHTADNAQIGENIYGNLVAYDYGFDPLIASSEQITNTSGYFGYSSNDTNTFFELLENRVQEVFESGMDYLTEEDYIALEEDYIKKVLE